MGKLILILSILLLLLVPTASLAEGSNQHYVDGFWPTNANECSHFSQVDQCQYLLCLCYAGCNIDNWSIDYQRKELCDGQ